MHVFLAALTFLLLRQTPPPTELLALLLARPLRTISCRRLIGRHTLSVTAGLKFISVHLLLLTHRLSPRGAVISRISRVSRNRFTVPVGAKPAAAGSPVWRVEAEKWRQKRKFVSSSAAQRRERDKDYKSKIVYSHRLSLHHAMCRLLMCLVSSPVKCQI